MNAYVAAWFLFSLYSFASARGCGNPEVTERVYTTTNGLVVANIAFVAEFDLKCSGAPETQSLYADVEGKIVPVVQSVDRPGHYQVSWTKELKESSGGRNDVRVFDDEGYSLLRKAQRGGDSIAGVKPLFTVPIHHPGTYQGPWLQSEFVAMTGFVVLAYFAHSLKSSILA